MTDEKKKRSVKAEPENQAGEFEQAGTPNIINEKAQAPLDETLTASAEELSDLRKELEETKTQCKEFFEGWQRERADFLNYKKRIERDQANLGQVISANIIKKYLAVMDDMIRASNHRPCTEDNGDWWAGFDLILRKLQAILDAEGVKSIASENDEFNPMYHEAISHEENSEVESGKIIEVVQQGYTIGDRVIRPAMVRVAR